jgi:chromosomal replication initiation ATPase DnaA
MTLEQLKQKVKNELINEAVISLNTDTDSELFNLLKERLFKEYHLIKRDIKAKDNINKDFIIDKVINVVSNNFGVSVEAIKSRSRKAPLPDARHVIIYVTRLLTNKNISLNHVCGSIGLIHCMGIHGVNKVTGLMDIDKTFKFRVDEIIGLCKKELNV